MNFIVEHLKIESYTIQQLNIILSTQYIFIINIFRLHFELCLNTFIIFLNLNLLVKLKPLSHEPQKL